MSEEQPKGRVEFKVFAGLQSNIDPSDLKPGAAQEQVNVRSRSPGKLEVRGGRKVVTWEN